MKDFEIIYLGLIDDQFKYKVKVNNNWFDYFTGIGWNAIAKTNPDKTIYHPLDQRESEIVKNSLSKFNRLSMHDNPMIRIYRRSPTIQDVLECLKSDLEAGNQSFNDFCDNFGYSNDSIKAFNTYQACMQAAEKLRGFDFSKHLKGE